MRCPDGRWVRPGGVLDAVALPRVDLPRELGVELAAAVAHTALGVAFAALRSLTGADLFRPEATHGAMPVAEPDRTVREVRADAARLLPGVRVRRLLFWRYLLVRRRPSACVADPGRPSIELPGPPAAGRCAAPAR